MAYNRNLRNTKLAEGAEGTKLTYQKLTAVDSVSIANGWLRTKNPAKIILLSPNRTAFKYEI